MGVLPKDENKLEDMVCILEHLQRYVPTLRQETQYQITSTEEETICTERFHRVLLGGDQLTVARVRSCQRGRANSDCAANRLIGLLPVAEDWHTGVVLLTVSKNNNGYNCSSKAGQVYTNFT